MAKLLVRLITPPGWAQRLAALVLVAIAFVVLERLQLLGGVPLWLLLGLLGFAWLAMDLTFLLWPKPCTQRELQCRFATQTVGMTAVMYATGWGPLLLVGYVYMAADNIRALGSRATLPSVVWATLGAAAGQVAIALGVAPTLIAAPEVHGLALLTLLGNALAIYLVGSAASQRELSEQEIRRLNEELEERVLERTADLEEANKELEAFSYSVSHDLRAPLRSMDGFSRILLEDHLSELPAEVQRYLEITRERARYMGSLVDGLLIFSRLSRQPLSKRPVDVAGLVREVLEELQDERSGRRVKIMVGALPVCQGDRALLRQVFASLLSNAQKFTRQRAVAKIEVGSEQAGKESNETVYFVRDNGAGFDMQYAGRLFRVFQRLHRAEDYEGTGVGLAIAHRLIHRHGGRIWVEAEVDNGATFYFTLGREKEIG